MAMSGQTTAIGKPTIVVNPIACVAHGVCAELFPESITLDEWGYPIIDPRPIPDHLLQHARRAVAECPTLALLIRDSHAGSVHAASPAVARHHPPAAIPTDELPTPNVTIEAERDASGEETKRHPARCVEERRVKSVLNAPIANNRRAANRRRRRQQG
jgi:ferredoxin